MTESKTVTRRRNNKMTALKKATSVLEPPTVSPTRPGGKLGLMVERLETADGATLLELTELTGWQSHTMRAALTRLRQRGFLIRLEDRDGRRAYRLGAGEG